MGWKAFKRHYEIRDIVHVTDAGLCIGTPDNPGMLVVARNGCIVRGGATSARLYAHEG